MKTITEIFVQVRDHLLQQNEKATVREICQYRGDNGNMCAVGCLIAEEHYDDSFEGTSIGTVETIKDEFPDERYVKLRRALKKSGVDLESDSRIKTMLHQLQNMHDAVDPEHWPERMDKIAEQNLNEEELKET